MINPTKYSIESFEINVNESMKNHSIIYYNKYKDDDSVLKISENSLDTYDSEGMTPLCFACGNSVPSEVIACLINLGANTNKKSLKNKSPLQMACSSMNTEAVKVLFGDTITYPVKDDNGEVLTEVHGKIVTSTGEDIKTYSKIEDDYEFIEYSVEVQSTIKINNPVEPTKNDLLSASSLPNGGELVKIILSKSSFELEVYEEAIILSLSSQCYDTLNNILAKIPADSDIYEYDKETSFKNEVEDILKRTKDYGSYMILSNPDNGISGIKVDDREYIKDLHDNFFSELISNKCYYILNYIRDEYKSYLTSSDINVISDKITEGTFASSSSDDGWLHRICKWPNGWKLD